MTTTCKDLLAAARTAIPSIEAAAAIGEVGSEVLFVDVRDEPELVRFGKVPGAVHVSRGTLEFIIDPASAFHNPLFFAGRRIVFYCASGARSVLAASTARNLGVADVANLEGGIQAWIAAGGPVAPHSAA